MILDHESPAGCIKIVAKSLHLVFATFVLTLLRANTNRMVKVLLQAHEVRRLDCAQMIKENLIWYVQRLKCSNFQHYTCRHAELDEHGLITWALKNI